jgi:hypothetical protein
VYLVGSIILMCYVVGKQNINNNNDDSVVTVLGSTIRLTLGCHGGGPSPFDTYGIALTAFTFTFFLLNH